MNHLETLDQAIDEALAAIASLKELKEQIEAAAQLMGESLDRGGKILACGNGGSAVDSAHFTTELLCRFDQDRRSLAAFPLSLDGSMLTAVANDYAFEEVFARQVAGLGKAGDVLVGFSTSGNSLNVLRALAQAREMGLKTVAVVGRDGGQASGLADVEILIPVQPTARIQEAMKVVIHLWCLRIEQILGLP
ncbi:MAG: SIS domain-containing protein [Verrucomicrobiota bacterium]